MSKNRKVIITCAVTGSIHTPSMSPYLPVGAQQIADAAVGAAQAGAAIVPGNVDASLLWQRINEHDPARVMPTPESGKRPISADERELLRRWITEGASYEKHWSFVPPERAPVPKLADTAWPGLFGVYYKTQRPTKNANEQSIITDLQGKSAGLEPWQILKKNFDRMK